jgi:hypothetical protein
MSVHLNESKSAVRLETCFGDITKVLEERDQIGLRSVRSQVAHVARGLPLGSLRNNHVIALDTVRWEMVVSEGSRWSHTHGGHRLLLGNGRLALLVGPIATDGARSQPLSIHGAECALSISTVSESDESVSTRPACLHIPHDASFRDRTEGREGLEKDLIIDLVR